MHTDPTAVADKSSLLNQLRIDRSEPAAVRRRPTLWWTLAAAAAIGGATLTAWHFSRSAEASGDLSRLRDGAKVCIVK